MSTSRIGRLLIGACALLAGPPAFAATINVPADQPTISDAIAAAAPGDVIDVSTGTYRERLDVPKGLDGLTIQGDSGGGTEIEDIPPTGANLVRIRSDGVLFQDFTLRGGNTAVRLDGSTGSTVRFLTIARPRKGVHVTNGEANEVSDCFVDDVTHGVGIDVSKSPFVRVIGISVVRARRGGIRVSDSPGAYVHGNAVDETRSGDAIRIQRVVDGTVDLNLVVGNARDGFRISRSPGILVEFNDAPFNGRWGFRVEHSPPIASVTDLQDLGNAAAENGSGDFLVVP
jgi:hypothetical protein